MAAAAALLALATGTASARTIDTGQNPIDETFTFTDCGYDISLHVMGTETWIDKLRGGDLEEFHYLTPWFTSVRGELTQSVTNLSTGKSFVTVVHTKSWDQRLLSVEGDVQTYRRAGTFHRTLYADGQREYVSVGKYTYDFEYDTLGTEDPTDDVDTFIDGSYRQVGNGRNDFCTDVIDYTTS